MTAESRCKRPFQYALHLAMQNIKKVPQRRLNPQKNLKGSIFGDAWWCSLSVSLGPVPVQKCVGDFCGIDFGGIYRGFSWRIFLGTVSHKMRRTMLQNLRKNPAARK